MILSLIFNAYVYQIIYELSHSRKAQGYDMMPMKFLQKSAPYIAPDIAKLVNNSIVKCVFPGDLKFAGMMSPLFKKEYALNKTNYRHVSILNALTKIYEKALSLKISEHFSNISFALLSAVRNGYNCKSTLLNMIENFKCAY